MAKAPLSDAQLAALRPLSTEEVARRDRAGTKPELAEAVRALRAEPDDDGRPGAVPSDVAAYIAPVAPPKRHDPTLEMGRVKLAPEVDPRQRPTVLVRQGIPPARGGGPAVVGIIGAAAIVGAIGVWWIGRSALAPASNTPPNAETSALAEGSSAATAPAAAPSNAAAPDVTPVPDVTSVPASAEPPSASASSSARRPELLERRPVF